MIAVYSVLLVLLNVVKFLIYRRARTLEKKYTRLSLATRKLAERPNGRQGNSNRHDVFTHARQQFELGKLVHRRDRVEAKYFAWQARNEKFARVVNAVKAWKGKKLPYLCGVADVSLVLYLVDYLGLGRIDLSQLAQTISTLIAK